MQAETPEIPLSRLHGGGGPPGLSDSPVTGTVPGTRQVGFRYSPGRHVPGSQGPSSQSGDALGFPDTALTSLPAHTPLVLLGAWRNGEVWGINGPTTSK